MNFRGQTLPGDPDGSCSKMHAGTLIVVGPERGYAAPPSPGKEVSFGRNRDEVHVPIGADDQNVSRQHGVFTCWGSGSTWEWRLRNSGNRPIKLLSCGLVPGRDLLLAGQERPLAPGYSPLVINPSGERSHLVKVRIIGKPGPGPQDITKDPTVPPETAYELSDTERLVLTALARLYLEEYEDHPRPLTWDETARAANGSLYSTKTWNERTVADTVVKVRERLHSQGVPGMRGDQFGQPLGNTLNVNLIHVLLGTGALSPRNLALLAEDD